jgi:hypothetical protein
MKYSVLRLINVKTTTEELYPCKRDLAPLVQDAWWASGPLRMGTKHIAPTRIQLPDDLAHPGCEGTVFNETLIGKNMKVSSSGLI